MNILFRAKTNEGYTIKMLSELLQNIVRIACLEVDASGIKMRMMDSHRRVLLDIYLEAVNFNIYEFNHDTTLYLGLNLGHLYKMLKMLKKKDALMMTIDKINPTQLNMIVYPKENNRISTSSIHIQTVQHINVPLPTGYTNSVIVPSNEYQRTLKDMNNIADTLDIQMKKFSLTISTTAQGIYSRNVLFGELDDQTSVQYTDQFEMEQFVRIVKISGLGKNLQIYSGTATLPLYIRSRVGQLGYISIYIKSKNQVKRDDNE